MTHDELLEKIGEAVGWEDKRPDGKTVLVIDYDDSPITKALRTVVELHKPIETYNMNNVHKSWLTCTHCNDEVYPCPTIQAIEAELI